jgi:hypothetical protein
MVTLFVRHPVKDFKAWHEAFLGFAELNAQYGASNPEVFHGVEDPNDVTVKQDLKSVEAAQKLLSSEEIKAAMGKAGVVGPPTIWIVKRIGK